MWFSKKTISQRVLATATRDNASVDDRVVTKDPCFTDLIGDHKSMSLIQFHQKRSAYRDRISKIGSCVPDLESLQIQSATASLAHGRFYTILYNLHVAFAFRAYDNGIFQSAHSIIFIP